MNVEILLFAGLREVAAADRVAVNLAPGMTYQQLRAQLEQTYPRLAPLLEYCHFTQGAGMAAESQPVDPTCKIALIPPVSGG